MGILAVLLAMIGMALLIDGSNKNDSTAKWYIVIGFALLLAAMAALGYEK